MANITLKNINKIYAGNTRAASNITFDINGWNPGDVFYARQELERNPEVDVFTWPYSAIDQGLTMVMKHKYDRPYWMGNGRNATK